MAGLIPHEFGLEKRAQLIFQVNVIRNAIAGKVLPVRGLGREWASRIQVFVCCNSRSIISIIFAPFPCCAKFLNVFRAFTGGMGNVCG